MMDSFINPWLLSGLALASLPVIIHLLNRRRYRVESWAAMDFLFRAQVSNRRRLRIEDLILLCLRILAICTLVFAVSRPVIHGFAGAREDERVIIVDDSGSTGLVGPTGSVFDAVRQTAESQIADAFAASIPVSVWFGSRPDEKPMTVTGIVRGGPLGRSAADDDPSRHATRAGSDLLNALRESEPGDASLRFGFILQRLLDNATDRLTGMRSVVLVSDFCRSDWLGEDGQLSETVESALEDVGKRNAAGSLRLQLIDLGQNIAANVAVTDFRVETHNVLVGVSVRIVVEVENFGDEPRERVEGEIEVGKAGTDSFQPNQRIALPVIESIPPGGTQSVEIRHVFDHPGQHPLRVRFANDRLKADDESHLVVTVKEGLRVAVVDGDPQADRLASESGFLIAALQPRGDEPTGILPSRVTTDIDAEVLDGVDVVLILNRSRVSAEERGALEDFLDAGGGVGFFLGNRVDATGYRELYERRPQKPSQSTSQKTSPGGSIFPVLLEDDLSRPDTAQRPRKEPTFLGIDRPDHPLLSAFRGRDSLSLEKVPFYNYFHLKPASGADVLVHYRDRERTPAIVEAASGNGRVVVFNTSADRGWSDWPADLSYPIVLHELGRYLAPSRSGENQVRVGESLSWRVTPGRRYEVIDPDGTRRPVGVEPRRPTTAGERADRESVKATKVGFYRVVTRRGAAGADAEGSSVERVEWFACRWRPRESDLDRIQEDRLRRALDPFGVDVSFGVDVEADAFRRRQEGGAWRYLALGAGVFLLVELVVAWWFARR